MSMNSLLYFIQATEEELVQVSTEPEEPETPRKEVAPFRSLRNFGTSLLPNRKSAQSEDKPRHASLDATGDVAATSESSPKFQLNVTQTQFPSLQVTGSSSAVSGFPPQRMSINESYPSLALSLEQLQEPPIEDCREATEELNDQVFFHNLLSHTIHGQWYLKLQAAKLAILFEIRAVVGTIFLIHIASKISDTIRSLHVKLNGSHLSSFYLVLSFMFLITSVMGRIECYT